jgi:hypothetical protein
MGAMEQQVRDELRLLAGQVTADQLRPLRAPARRVFLRRRWWLPAVAALAVGLAVLLPAVSGSGGRQAPSTARGQMPPFYVTVAGSGAAGLRAVVHASATGKVTGSATIPVKVLAGRVMTSWQVTGAADGRHFAISVSSAGDLPGVYSGLRVFSLTVSDDGHAEGLPERDVAAKGDFLSGMALSPDGTRLAVTFQHTSLTGQSLTGRVEVVDLGTGTVSASRDKTVPDYWPGVPSWADGQTLTVPWWHDTSPNGGGMVLTAIHQIDASRPDGVLVTTRVITYPVPVSGLSSAEVTAAGRELLAPVCNVDGSKVTYRLTQRSAANGRLIRFLVTLTTRLDLKGSSDNNSAYSSGMSVAVSCTPPSVDASGRHVLIDAVGFGRIDNRVYTPLPGLPAISMQPDSAW